MKWIVTAGWGGAYALEFIHPSRGGVWTLLGIWAFVALLWAGWYAISMLTRLRTVARAIAAVVYATVWLAGAAFVVSAITPGIRTDSSRNTFTSDTTSRLNGTSADVTAYADEVTPITADAAQQLQTISDGASAGSSGDFSTAASDFGAAHDGLTTDSSHLSDLTPPASLAQVQTNLEAALNTCAQVASDAQTGANNSDTGTLQTAAAEITTCNSQLDDAQTALSEATGQ